MTERLSDSTLGNRFWAVTDFSMQPITGADATDATAAPVADVKHNTTITSFVNAGGDTMAQSAINKAELFAASHTVDADEMRLETEVANRNLETLIGDEDAVDGFIEEAAEKYVEMHPGVEKDEAKDVCRTALRKLMVTQEFDDRAHVELPPSAGLDGDDATARRLGPQGLAALKNAVIGLGSMLKDGKISEKAVLILADSHFYDASNRPDMLRLAADSAQKVKELFIGEERFNALIQQCKDRLAEIQDTLTPAKKDELEAQITHLEQLRDQAVAERKKATACIKTDYQFTDPTGEVKYDKKYQKQQIDQIRDSLRAFRYDIDRATGKPMGKMEKMRRFFDNARSSVDKQSRMTADQLVTIRKMDDKFNTSLGKLRDELFRGAPAEEARGELDDYEKVSGNVSRTDKMDIDACCVAATKLSHLTNDRIRYHYSGVEKREAANYKDISKALGDIAANGGSRTVTFKVGVDAVAGLGLIGLEGSVKAGVTGEVTAQIKVNNANGSVEVTYSGGGGLQSGATLQFGVDPKSKIPQSGVGVNVDLKAFLGATYSSTKTYANLAEFAKTVSKLNMVMNPRPHEIFFSYGGAAIKGIRHLFKLGATATGFRISSNKMDQLAYSAELRNRNIFGDGGGVYLKKRNVEVVAERSTVTIKSGAKVQAEGGLYFQTGAHSVGSNIDAGVGLSGDVSLDVYASGKLYKSFAKTLMLCSAHYLQESFNAEAAEMDGAWKDELATLVQDGAEENAQGIAQSLSKLSDKLTELEESAIGKKSNDKEFWNGFAAKARLLAVATALLTKRADALEPGLAGAAEAKTAAKAACEYIIPRLANPVVKVPSKVFQENFYDIFNVSAPLTSRAVGSFNVHADFLGNFFGTGLTEVKKLGNEVVPILGGPVASAGTSGVLDIAKETTGLSSKVEVRVTREDVISKHKDPRPWLNSSKTLLDVRVYPNMPMRAILDIAARYYVKSAGGLDDVDESKFEKEFIDGVKDGLKVTGDDIGISTAKSVLDLTLDEAVKESPVFSKLFDGFKGETLKTVRFEFGPGGRFSSFTLADDYESEAKLGFAGSSVGVNLSLSYKNSTNDWVVMPKPTVNSIMKRAADYAAAGNPEGFVSFLQRNKKGVLRLVEAGRTGAPAPAAKDKYWDKDVDSIQTTIQKCTELLGELANKGGHIAEQAHLLQQTFESAADAMQNHAEDIAPNDALKIAERFFDTAAKIYTLTAMAA